MQLARGTQVMLGIGATAAAIGGGIAAHRLIGDRDVPYVDLPGPGSVEDAIGNLPFFVPAGGALLATSLMFDAGRPVLGAAGVVVTGALFGATMTAQFIGREQSARR